MLMRPAQLVGGFAFSWRFRLSNRRVLFGDASDVRTGRPVRLESPGYDRESPVRAQLGERDQAEPHLMVQIASCA